MYKIKGKEYRIIDDLLKRNFIFILIEFHRFYLFYALTVIDSEGLFFLRFYGVRILFYSLMVVLAIA